jgi:hypothetical protein
MMFFLSVHKMVMVSSYVGIFKNSGGGSSKIVELDSTCNFYLIAWLIDSFFNFFA